MNDNFHSTRPRKILLINSRPLDEDGAAQLLAITRNLPEDWEVFAACPIRTVKRNAHNQENISETRSDATMQGNQSGSSDGANTADVPVAAGKHNLSENKYSSELPLTQLRQSLGEDHIFIIPSVPFSPFTLYELMRLCWLRGIHLTHSHGTGAGVYARLLKLTVGIPCVHTFPHHTTDQKTGVTGFLSKVYERGTSLLTRKGIVLSRNEYDHIVSAKVFPTCKLCCLEDDIYPESDDTPIGTAADAPNMQTKTLKVAAHLPRHDGGASSRLLLQMLDLLQDDDRLKNMSFLVFGSGPNRRALEEELQKNGLDPFVEFAGVPETTQEIRHLLHGTSCYVELDLGRSFGATALQAMSCAVPLVAPDTNVFKQILTNGCNALLYTRGSAQSAMHNLLQMIDQPDAARCMGASARQLSGELLRIRELAERIDGVYRSVALPPISPDPMDINR